MVLEPLSGKNRVLAAGVVGVADALHFMLFVSNIKVLSVAKAWGLLLESFFMFPFCKFWDAVELALTWKG